jgi:hypothetical protein
VIVDALMATASLLLVAVGTLGTPGYGYGYGGYGLDPLVYGPVLSPAPIPGQIPYTYPLPLFSPAPVPGQLPNTVPLAPEAQGPALVGSGGSTANPGTGDDLLCGTKSDDPAEPIVPIKELPLLGTTRAEVEAKYGEPWGIVTVRGQEKVYFRNMLVVFENGQAVQVQRH